MMLKYTLPLALLLSWAPLPVLALGETKGTLYLSNANYTFENDGNIAKVSVTFKIINSFKDDICVPKDIASNDLSPYAIVRDGHSDDSIPNPPIVDGDIRIPVGASLEFERIVAYLPRGKKTKVSVDVFGRVCGGKSVEFSSRAFVLINR